jgi:hypothetical protein
VRALQGFASTLETFSTTLQATLDEHGDVLNGLERRLAAVEASVDVVARNTHRIEQSIADSNFRIEQMLADIMARLP